MARRLAAVVVAMALMTAQTALAQDAPAQGAPPAEATQPLAPGGAAGVQAAQSGPNLNAVAIGAGVVLVAAAIYFIAGTHYRIPKQSSSAAAKK